MTQGLVLHYVQSGLTRDSQDLETTQMPHNGRIDTEIWFIYTMEYYSSVIGQPKVDKPSWRLDSPVIRGHVKLVITASHCMELRAVAR